MTERRPFKLDQLGSVARGKSRHRPRNDPRLYDGKWPFFQTGDVKAAELHLRNFTQTYNDAGLAQSKLWPEGTLCITIAANIAETAILAIPGCFPDSIVGFIPDPKKSDARFIKYYIETLKVRMQNASKGTTQDNLSVDKLMTFDFVVPIVEEQSRIASILSVYDDLIENNTRRIAILEEMAGRIYEEWFVRFRFPGHENTRMVESKIGPVPEGWQMCPFTEIAEVLSGGTPKKAEPSYWGGTIPFFTPTDAPQVAYVLDTEAHITVAGLERCASRLYPKNTVFITARGTVGKLALASRDMAMNQSCYALQARAGYGQLYLYLATKAVVSELKAKSHGAVFDTIIMDTFRLMQIVKPPTEVAARFEHLIRPILKLSLVLTHKNANLRATRDLLLPKLISGELDVAALPAEAVAA